MSIINNLPDEHLVDALEAYAKMKQRASNNFKPGSAAHAELDKIAAQCKQAATYIKAGNVTPLEQAIERKK